MLVVGWNQTFRRTRETLISATPALCDSQARALHGEADLSDAGNTPALVFDGSSFVVHSTSTDLAVQARPRVPAGRSPSTVTSVGGAVAA